MTAARKTARKLGLGKVLRHLYHRPIGLARKSIAEGGPLQQMKTAAGEKQMIEAAMELTPLRAPIIGPAAEVSFLTGPRFWHQTVFCFLSLQLRTDSRITPNIYSDGSLFKETVDQILRVIPWAKIHMHEEIEAKLDTILPETSYPTLRQRRREYPHLRKFIDLHLDRPGYTIVADSDMLFFRRPSELMKLFESQSAFFIQDIGNAYGYPLEFLNELLGEKVPEKVNVGLYGLDSSTLDWDEIEHWCRQQIEVHGPHYLQEQGLTAMALARANPVVLPRDEYLVMPSLSEGRIPTAALHHYVAETKRSYFQNTWRLIAKECADMQAVQSAT